MSEIVEANEVPKARESTVMHEVGNNLGHFLVECPGCKMFHCVNTVTEGRPKWTWNGDMEKPTFSPSLLVTYNYGVNNVDVVCHSFIVDGVWQFLGDCTHELAGQNVPMVPMGTFD
jgi:hypothetical protein